MLGFASHPGFHAGPAERFARGHPAFPHELWLRRERAERAAEQLEQQLRQAQKMEALGTLAGGVAHDFNNILAAIVGFAELARADRGDPAAFNDDLEEILQAASRGRSLVQQILTFSRQRTRQRRSIRLQRVIDETLRLLAPTLPSGITIERRIDAECPPIEAVELSVADTGAGIGPEDLERIFDPFYSTKGPHGTGLGLSVVDGVVAGHGGRVSVSSEPERGSNFTVALPLRPPDSPPAEEEDAAAGRAAPRIDARILLVDDEPAVLRATRRMLTSCRAEVEAYERPDDAMAALEAEPQRFDLVVTDQIMPGMSGLDLARRARRTRADLPTLIVTGRLSRDRDAALERADDFDVLLKPFNRAQLADAVMAALNGQSSCGAAVR